MGWTLIAVSGLTFASTFLLFHVVERYVLVHHVHTHEADGRATPAHVHDQSHTVGGLGASGLVLHSLLDGVAIGAAFQASSQIGPVVALAVIATTGPIC